MTSESDPAQRVFSLSSSAYGLSYGSWTEKWLRWLLSIPKPFNPSLDTTGIYCGKDQREYPVWFLAGSLGGTANRSCAIPEGKAILLPIIVDIQSFAERPEFTSESQLITLVQSEADKVLETYAAVDGQQISNLKSHRIQTKPFDVTLPEDNICGVKAGPTRAAADGYWLLVQPMSAGKHSIHIMGRGPRFRTEVIYDLTVRKI